MTARRPLCLVYTFLSYVTLTQTLSAINTLIIPQEKLFKTIAVWEEWCHNVFFQTLNAYEKKIL